MTQVETVNAGNSKGFKVAKKFFDWDNLSQVDAYYKASNVIYLARLIDEADAGEKNQ